MKERFGKFLEDLVDWNISRDRYWGTPLNIWVCEETGEQFAPHSIAELRARAVGDVPENLELHKTICRRSQSTQLLWQI